MHAWAGEVTHFGVLQLPPKLMLFSTASDQQRGRARMWTPGIWLQAQCLMTWPWLSQIPEVLTMPVKATVPKRIYKSRREGDSGMKTLRLGPSLANPSQMQKKSRPCREVSSDSTLQILWWLHFYLPLHHAHWGRIPRKGWSHMGRGRLHRRGPWSLSDVRAPHSISQKTDKAMPFTV